MKKKQYLFFMLKSILKCLVSIRILKKWVKKFQNSECQLGERGGGRGGSGQVGQKPSLKKKKKKKNHLYQLGSIHGSNGLYTRESIK